MEICKLSILIKRIEDMDLSSIIIPDVKEELSKKFNIDKKFINVSENEIFPTEIEVNIIIKAPDDSKNMAALEYVQYLYFPYYQILRRKIEYRRE